MTDRGLIPAPPALLDECTDLELVEALRARGYVVDSVQQIGLRGQPDDLVLEQAAQRDRVLITHNERHFRLEHRRCLKEGRGHGGIACISQVGPIDRLTIRAAMLLDWIGTQERRSQFFVWGHLQRQLERGLRLPGYSEDDVRYALGRD
jgi:hypothetical protein